MNDETLDPSRCPLCGQSNQCSECGSGDRAQPCWCFSAQIADGARARIPAAAQGKACLCPRCARAELPAKA